MTLAADELPVSPQPPRGLAGPLSLWLALQSGTLLLAGLQTPLSDKFTRPAERLAIEEMLVAQIVFSALLFPIVLRSFWTALAGIATSWPMLALAGILSTKTTAEIVRGGTYVSLWMALLAIWCRLLPGWRGRLIGCALASGFSIGGGLLAYLGAEFGSTASPLWDPSTPIPSALGALEGWHWTHWRGITYLSIATALALAAKTGLTFRRK